MAAFGGSFGGLGLGGYSGPGNVFTPSQYAQFLPLINAFLRSHGMGQFAGPDSAQPPQHSTGPAGTPQPVGMPPPHGPGPLVNPRLNFPGAPAQHSPGPLVNPLLGKF